MFSYWSPSLYQDDALELCGLIIMKDLNKKKKKPSWEVHALVDLDTLDNWEELKGVENFCCR
jgi:hypothetical protein